MRFSQPDPSSPVQTVTHDYPEGPFAALAAWLLAVPTWQRTPQRVSERVQDFKQQLATLRATGVATPVVERAADPPIEIRATPPLADLGETPGQRQARRMREAKAAKAKQATA